MDSMTEMFYDESNSILEEMRTALRKNEEESVYGQEIVQELFRGVHTLKANALMMMYENMASVSKLLESLLYCFRGEGRQVEDKRYFRSVIEAYLDFYGGEVERLSRGIVPSQKARKLEIIIQEYINQMRRGMDANEEREYQARISKPKRQVYYISGAASDDGEQPAKAPAVKYHSDVVLDFVPVAKKLEIAVDEMCVKLGKAVKLSVEGQETVIDRSSRDKISGALLHVVRNAVDHGIEDMSVREQYGKTPMGLIRLKFFRDSKGLEVSVEDDGAGIDAQRVMEIAKKNGILTKSEEEYSEKEIYQLLLVSGFTTNTEVNEYSGRGVGMDVLNSNVEALGGTLEIESKRGIGTRIVMHFPTAPRV